MGINYEEPYCQGISFLDDLPNELDPNAVEYLPMKMLNISEETLPTKTDLDNSVLKTFDKNLEIWEITDDEVKLLNGLWLPELNGYSLSHPAPLEINKDFSNFNENPGNFFYDSLQYIPQSQNFNEISKISDNNIFNNASNSQSVNGNFSTYNPISDQTVPHERLEVYSLPSDSSHFNQNAWISYNHSFTQSPQEFPDQTPLYEQQAFFLEMPHGAYFQNSPYQACVDGNFNNANIPNSTLNVPNNYVPDSFVPNNYVANSFVPNNYMPNNYEPTNYVQVNSSQTCGMPAPMEKITYESPNNFGSTNMNSQFRPTYNCGIEVEPHTQPTRNSSFNSYREPLSSWKQSNKGHSNVPSTCKEQSVRIVKYNNERSTEYEKTEFPSNIKDNHTRPPYVSEFSKSTEDYSRPPRLITKFQERSSSLKNQETVVAKHNAPHQNFKTLKPHPYRQLSTSKKIYCAKDNKFSDTSEVKNRQFKENVGYQTPNSNETSSQPTEQKDQSKYFGGLKYSKQSRSAYHLH